MQEHTFTKGDRPQVLEISASGRTADSVSRLLTRDLIHITPAVDGRAA